MEPTALGNHFLKTLCGIHDDYVGTLQISPSVNMGYFSQELENLNYGATILEDVLTVGGSVGDVRLFGMPSSGEMMYSKG